MIDFLVRINWHGEALHEATIAAARPQLRRGAGLTRKIARQSIRRRKRTSSPGQPPSSRLGLLKRFILFGELDPLTYVIGPTAIRPSLAPKALEHGGLAIVSAKTRSSGRRRWRVRIRKRPFMRPALRTAMPKILPTFTGIV